MNRTIQEDVLCDISVTRLSLVLRANLALFALLNSWLNTHI